MFLPVPFGVSDITRLMHKLTIAFSGSNYPELIKLKQEVSKRHKDIKIEKANLETLPGAVEPLSVLGVTLSIIAENSVAIVGDWLYGLLKAKSPDAMIELHIDGVKVRSREEITAVLEKRLKAGKKL
jgi:hypothetical protein